MISNSLTIDSAPFVSASSHSAEGGGPAFTECGSGLGAVRGQRQYGGKIAFESQSFGQRHLKPGADGFLRVPDRLGSMTRDVVCEAHRPLVQAGRGGDLTDQSEP